MKIQKETKHWNFSPLPIWFIQSADDSSSVMVCVASGYNVCVCLGARSDLCNITNKDLTLIYIPRAIENTGDGRYCWRLLCVLEREGVFCFSKGVSSPLPPAWRGETSCGAHWGLTGAPEAHTEEGCRPEQGPEERCGLGSLTGTSWRNKEVKVRIYNIGNFLTQNSLVICHNFCPR